MGTPVGRQFMPAKALWTASAQGSMSGEWNAWETATGAVVSPRASRRFFGFGHGCGSPGEHEVVFGVDARQRDLPAQVRVVRVGVQRSQRGQHGPLRAMLLHGAGAGDERGQHFFGTGGAGNGRSGKFAQAAAEQRIGPQAPGRQRTRGRYLQHEDGRMGEERADERFGLAGFRAIKLGQDGDAQGGGHGVEFAHAVAERGVGVIKRPAHLAMLPTLPGKQIHNRIAHFYRLSHEKENQRE